MAILNHDEFMGRLKAHLGDDTSDEAMGMLEDFTDTLNDLEGRATGTSEAEWQKKYDDLDKSWRDKYKARFFEGGTTGEEALAQQTENVKSDGDPREFAELFEEREG